MKFFVILLVGVAFSMTTITAQSYGQPYEQRVISQKSSYSGSYEMTITPDPRPAWARRFPIGDSTLRKSLNGSESRSSSWSVNTEGFSASGGRNEYAEATPTYNPLTGEAEITAVKSDSAATYEEKRESVPLDYYGRPITPTHRPKKAPKKKAVNVTPGPTSQVVTQVVYITITNTPTTSLPKPAKKK